jgi:hypothetical protein
LNPISYAHYTLLNIQRLYRYKVNDTRTSNWALYRYEIWQLIQIIFNYSLIYLSFFQKIQISLPKELELVFKDYFFKILNLAKGYSHKLIFFANSNEKGANSNQVSRTWT